VTGPIPHPNSDLAALVTDATRDILRERGGLWFFDESYVISRRRA
jgi:hypothetical protein